MSNKKIKAILFDKDGVLVDFQATYGTVTREIMEQLSQGNGELLARLASDVGFNLSSGLIDPVSSLVEGCAEDICAIWAEVLRRPNDREFQISVDAMFKQLTETNVVLIDGVGEVLNVLGANYYLGLATNDTQACARAQLSFARVLQHFKFLAGYDSGHGPKPGTGMAEAFLANCSLNADQVVMVGDSIHDMNFAKSAGMTAIGISTGPLPADDLSVHAEHMIDSLDELQPLIKQL